jgi:hypothetical protein
MAYTIDILRQAWKRSDGRCECMKSINGHSIRCNKPLITKNKDKWEPQTLSRDNKDTLSNCRIYCLDCHKATTSNN